LPMDHLWRLNKRTFNDNQELESAPHVQSGDDILGQLKGMVFGDESVGKKKEKKRKKRRVAEDAIENVVWKKKSIFFRLSYWKDNLLRHNLDVMHIGKNVTDNILGTILDIKGKTKDDYAVRKD